MTTPGGVSNLPPGAMTLATLRSNLQDMSTEAMRARAAARFPGTYDASTGGSPAADISPFGILTAIFSAINSLIANADPADIQGPEDLPDKFNEFITGIPVVGEFVELLAAITGTYDGEADVLLAIQDIFAPIRALLEAVGGVVPTAASVISGWAELLTGVSNAQDTADLALGLILGRVGSGVGTTGMETFTGASASDAGPNYDDIAFGAASNLYYLDGNGVLRFDSTGFISNWCIVTRNDKHFVGDCQTTGLYLPSKIATGVEMLLLNRWSRANFGGYCARVTSTQIQGCYITTSGGTPTFHNIGSPMSYTQSNGEYWEFDVGEADGSDDYMLRVRRNSDAPYSYSDTGHNVAPDPAYRDIAAGGGSAALFGVTPAPAYDTQTWYERA